MATDTLLYKSNFINPYVKKPEGYKPAFAYDIFSKMAGVYIIKRGNDILYVGSSQVNLYKTLYRHFEIWNHKEQKVISYADDMEGIKVRVFITHWETAPDWEKYFIQKLNPLHNTFKYNEGRNRFTAPKHFKRIEKKKRNDEDPF
jgi:hypothetical protein